MNLDYPKAALFVTHDETRTTLELICQFSKVTNVTICSLHQNHRKKLQQGVSGLQPIFTDIPCATVCSMEIFPPVTCADFLLLRGRSL